MNKTLLKSEQEFTDFVNTLIDKGTLFFEEAERLFNIDFENKEGQSYEEYLDSLPEDATEECFEAGNKFRTSEESDVPKSYPCLVLHIFADDFDRIGNIEYRVCEYIYPSDFNL